MSKRVADLMVETLQAAGKGHDVWEMVVENIP